MTSGKKQKTAVKAPSLPSGAAASFDHQQLDEIIHSRLRLAIMAMLASVEQAPFTALRAKVNATDGNLSVQLKKLEDAKYVSVKKSFLDRKPVSTYRLTELGRTAFETYLNRLEQLLKH